MAFEPATAKPMEICFRHKPLRDPLETLFKGEAFGYGSRWVKREKRQDILKDATAHCICAPSKVDREREARTKAAAVLAGARTNFHKLTPSFQNRSKTT